MRSNTARLHTWLTSLAPARPQIPPFLVSFIFDISDTVIYLDHLLGLGLIN